MGINFTNNKVISSEIILRRLILTACIKVSKGLDLYDCARRAGDEAIQGILVPTIEKWG